MIYEKCWESKIDIYRMYVFRTMWGWPIAYVYRIANEMHTCFLPLFIASIRIA